MKYDEMKFAEKKEVVYLFSNWLRKYSHDVIMRVMARRDEIMDNEFAMNLLKELKEREEKEEKDFVCDIGSMFDDYDTFSEFNPHSHPLTHAGSYRDVLYDMYIKEVK